ncbi:MAG: alpha/beta hydrolase, partial [Bacteroidota bacterium]
STIDLLEGNWSGGFIANNAQQKLDMQCTNREGQLFCLQIMEEWHPTFGEFEVPVRIDSTGIIKLPTGYGEAHLLLDKNNLELHGSIKENNPVTYLHLKKVPDPPKATHSVEAVTISSNGLKLQGHFHQPKVNDLKTAVIIVGGRGCYPDQTQFNLYAKLLRQYGISVLAYQKRGTGGSEGNCGTATIEDLANDLASVKEFITQHPNQYRSIGVLGISAGAWVMAKAEEKIDFDFMISIVGPATSVRDQQLQSMKTGSVFYKLSETVRQNLERYTKLMLNEQSDAQQFEQMQQLLSLAEKEDWKKLLEDTDQPKTMEEIDQLWVRRFRYDPAKVLQNFNKPF